MKAKEVFPRVFSRHAAAYRDRILPPLLKGEARGRLLTIELLRLRPGERVLDLASGPGTLTNRLAEAVGFEGTVVATDLAEGMLRLAREAAPANVAVALMDSERLALRDGAFDAAACGHGLQFCPDLAAALRECRRVLKPGGRFAASFPASLPGRNSPTFLSEVLAELPPAPEVPDQAGTLAILADPESVRAAALDTGFSEADVARVDETVSYSSAEELVSRVFGWWDCAWRLETVSARKQGRLRSLAVKEVRRQLGDGPLQLPGATSVLFARR